MVLTSSMVTGNASNCLHCFLCRGLDLSNLRGNLARRLAGLIGKVLNLRSHHREAFSCIPGTEPVRL